MLSNVLQGFMNIEKNWIRVVNFSIHFRITNKN